MDNDSQALYVVKKRTTNEMKIISQLSLFFHLGDGEFIHQEIGLLFQICENMDKKYMVCFSPYKKCIITYMYNLFLLKPEIGIICPNWKWADSEIVLKCPME